MGQREVRRWIDAPPERVFEVLGRYLCSFAWISEGRPGHSAPPLPMVGAILRCPLQRSTCSLCIQALEPTDTIRIEIRHAGQQLDVCFWLQPQSGGTLLGCRLDYHAPLMLMRSATTRIYHAIGNLPTLVKQRLEQPRH
ncbi:MAG: hypothetical protein Fur005_08650 [Roseiflexaceae bacterium]